MMIRTQIYLTEKEKKALNDLSAASGKNQSELIREAIDEFVAKTSRSRREAVFDRAAGIWKDRDDLPDFEELRKSWDRDFGF
jgi:metal-responsive CopG/Arc/MetJ family transcriptional regulator